MSFRSFFYEDFDQDSQASIAGAIDGPAGAISEREGRLCREIESVRREGCEAGRAQGLTEGRRAALEEAEVRLARDLPDLLTSLGGAVAEMGRVKLACERDALLLTSAALGQMLPIIAERGLGREAAALVAEVVANVPAPVIEVRASPRTRQAIERWCGRLPSGVTLVTDGDVPEGGVRCAWSNGQAHFDGAAVTREVLAILDRCVGQAPAMSPSVEQGVPQKD